MFGFWVFTLATDLLVPGVMIVFGRMFSRQAPQKINNVFGYRTAMSMKNKDTWEFAHTYCGRLWFCLGWVMLPVSLFPILLVYDQDVGTMGTVGTVVCFVQLVPMLGSIVLTEIALRKTFDRNGNRKGVL